MFANASNSSDTLMTWLFIPISEFIIIPFSLLFNGLAIVTFLLNSHLRTPFNFYPANLVLTNFLYILIESSLDVVNGLSSSWWMGVAVCDLYQYISNVFIGIIVNTHMLITLNRIWALAFPHSYAHQHTIKTAVIGCSAVWLYVHAACLPGLVINAWNRLPLETSGCTLNYQVLFEWNILVEFAVFVLPQTLIIAAYPYLLYKRRNQRRVRRERRKKRLVERLTTNTATLQEKMKMEKRSGHRQRDNKRAFGVLTASTLSATLTWTPGIVYYGMSCFMDVSYFPIYLITVNFLFLVQTLMDPVLLMLVLSELRTAAWKIVNRCDCHFSAADG